MPGAAFPVQQDRSVKDGLSRAMCGGTQALSCLAVTVVCMHDVQAEYYILLPILAVARLLRKGGGQYEAQTVEIDNRCAVR